MLVILKFGVYLFVAICYEKTKQNVAKKLSSNIKRRASSPEEITLAPLEVETKVGSMNRSVLARHILSQISFYHAIVVWYCNPFGS